MREIRTVTVIGVTGTMGANVAGIFAAFGDCRVYCVGRDLEKVRSTLPRIVKSVRADAIAKNLIPADFGMLAGCVADSDLVFESTAEDLALKEEIARSVARALREGAISCTGTSGLSIHTLAACYPEEARKRFFGVHLFNPPYSMPLCELTPTRWSDPQTLKALREYLEGKLYRTVVQVKDAPAFLANRIGFQFINEALQYAQRCRDNGGIDYLDAILGPFTGRAMAPLVTSDFVGLDVHSAIVRNVYDNTADYARESFVLPEFAEKLIAEKKLGRKTGGGLYQRVTYENGLKRQLVYDINGGVYRDVIPYAFPFAEKMKKNIAEGNYQRAFERLVSNHSQEANICRHFLLNYIVYSLHAAMEAGCGAEAADDVMAAGFNWCPPLALVQALSLAADVPALIRENLPEVCEKTDLDALWAMVKPSVYDYRPFFKSGRRV